MPIGSGFRPDSFSGGSAPAKSDPCSRHSLVSVLGIVAAAQPIMSRVAATPSVHKADRRIIWFPFGGNSESMPTRRR
jgi:hypothetical protein